MKSLLITGMSGTLAPVVANYFRQQDWNIIVWDHHQVDPTDEQQCQQFIESNEFDAICHLAMGSEQWAGYLAGVAKQHQIPFVFTSTVMVFDNQTEGPYTIFDQRNSTEDYGQYKMRCEDAIWQANPEAMIARIGWQIGEPQQGGNNMLAILEQQVKEQGHISASTHWFPATSSMTDTAAGLFQLIDSPIKGLHHFDSNYSTQWTYYDLVCKLVKHYNLGWEVKANQDYHHDQRLQPLQFNLRDLNWLN